MLRHWFELHNVLAEHQPSVFDLQCARGRTLLHGALPLGDMDHSQWPAAIARHGTQHCWLTLGADDASSAVFAAAAAGRPCWKCFAVSEALCEQLARRLPCAAEPERFTLPSRITASLYLGDYASAALSERCLHECGITHVVNASQRFGNKFPQAFVYLDVSVDDEPHEPLHEHFDRVVAFVRDAIDGGGAVLVHCAAGVSRSTTLVLAYLVRAQGLSVRHACSLVKSRRTIVAPNVGFMRQLLRYAGEDESKNVIHDWIVIPDSAIEHPELQLLLDEPSALLFTHAWMVFGIVQHPEQAVIAFG